MSTESNVKGGQTTSGTMDKDATSTKFSQLQREYRAMESNRKTYTDESLQLLRRQQASVEKLLRENEKLKAEIGLETKHVTKSVASAHQAQLAKLQDQLETYAKRMTSGHSKFETTTAQIHVMRQKVKNLLIFIAIFIEIFINASMFCVSIGIASKETPRGCERLEGQSTDDFETNSDS